MNQATPTIAPPKRKKAPKNCPDDGSGSILGWDFMTRKEYLRRLETAVAAGSEINWWELRAAVAQLPSPLL